MPPRKYKKTEEVKEEPKEEVKEEPKEEVKEVKKKDEIVSEKPKRKASYYRKYRG